MLYTWSHCFPVTCRQNVSLWSSTGADITHEKVIFRAMAVVTTNVRIYSHAVVIMSFTFFPSTKLFSACFPEANNLFHVSIA